MERVPGRRLAAILAADMVGYSRLMSSDEVGTLAVLNALRREVIDTSIAKAGGRIVKTTGDGLLAEFPSVVDSIQCAVEIQREIALRNEAVPTDRRAPFRIGINIGDVIIDKGDLFGDGVNVAARLEAMASPGGICISAAAYDQVKTKLPLDYDDLGLRQLKNLGEKVHVFSIRTAGGIVPRTNPRTGQTMRHAALLGVAVMAVGLTVFAWRGLPLPAEVLPPATTLAAVQSTQTEMRARANMPSLAVLRFTPVQRGPNDTLIADGFSDELSDQISRLPGLLVLSSTAIGPIVGRSLSPRQAANLLAVDHVLSGRLEWVYGRIKVTAELWESRSGTRLWSKAFDRPWSGQYEIRTAIARDAAASLGLSDTSVAKVERSAPPNFDAWIAYRQGLPARTLLEQAVQLDGGFAEAQVALADTYRAQGQSFPGDKRSPFYYALAHEHLELARTLDPLLPALHARLATLFVAEGDFGKAMEAATRAAELDANNWYVRAVLGMTLVNAARPSEAMDQLVLAMRLNPLQPDLVLNSMGEALLVAGRPAEAKPYFEDALARNPARTQAMLARLFLALVEAKAGEADRAREQIRLVSELLPNTTLRSLRNHPWFKGAAFAEDWAMVWRDLDLGD